MKARATTVDRLRICDGSWLFPAPQGERDEFGPSRSILSFWTFQARNRPSRPLGGLYMFGSIGMPELIIILVIALIIFGPRKLPELGKSLGRSINEFKKASTDLQNTLEQEIKIEEQKENAAKARAEQDTAGAAFDKDKDDQSQPPSQTVSRG